MRTAAFSDNPIAPCGLVRVDQRYRGTYCLQDQGLIMEELGTSVTSVYFNETTGHYSPQSCHFLGTYMFGR
jgi:hypothetical protein